MALPNHSRKSQNATDFQKTQSVNLSRYFLGTNVLTKKNAPQPAAMKNAQTPRALITTALPNEFHKDLTTNVTSRVLTRKQDVNIFERTQTIFKLSRDIITTNVLTKCHEDWNKNVTSKKNTLPPAGHVFQQTRRQTGQKQYTLTSRVLTRFYKIHIRKNATPPEGHVFQPTGTIFKLFQDIIGTHSVNNVHVEDIFKRSRAFIRANILTKFHKDWTINVTSREITRKNARPPDDIIRTNLLTKFHEDWTMNVTSRELTRCFYSHIMKNACTLTRTIFELIKEIFPENLLTNFHEDLTINKNAPPHGGNFHENWTINVTSRVLTGFYYSHIRKITFQDIIGTNLLTKFHEDLKINVASEC
ncbi:hypothetical protein DPMN_194989 [Dreissena polymorpha]|uniref:Uncharacterized protein n=1 Tax=Dreissena polymorpha TaxID=45954 RepID=A0A9D3Y075_DREPO|nr:hypothetical protein DPMN_194989 [Dreissena polymorpha]